MAIGMAVEEQMISLDDRVLSFFPDKSPGNATGFMKKLTIRHLLTMSSGQPDGSWAYIRQAKRRRLG